VNTVYTQLPLCTQTKRCTKCGVTKPVDQFAPRGDAPHLLRSHCRECRKATKAEYRAANIEAVRASDAAYREQNAEVINARIKRWYAEHPDRAAEMRREERQRNADRRKAYNRAYREAHPDLYRNAYNNRRARLKGNGGTHTVVEWAAVKAAQDYTCPHCRKREPEITLTRDHIIPLSKGGTNDIGNVQGLCALCNSRKSAKIVQ
jgi:5-methylcytosine-specific restriction endonuclease McrA